MRLCSKRNDDKVCNEGIGVHDLIHLLHTYSVVGVASHFEGSCRYVKSFIISLTIGVVTLLYNADCIAAERDATKSAVVRFYSEIAPPFYWLNNNDVPQGVNVDLAKALTEILSIEASIDHLPWARAYYEVEHHADIVLLSVLKTPAREHTLQWLGVVDIAEASLIRHTRRDDIEVSTWQDIYQYRVATIRGYGAADYLLQNGFEEDKNLVLVKSPKELWQSLYSGRVDLVLSNFITGKYEIAETSLDPNDIESEFTVVPLNLEIQMATGLQTSPARVNALRQGLTELKANGEYQRIMRKWGLEE